MLVANGREGTRSKKTAAGLTPCAVNGKLTVHAEERHVEPARFTS
jgi:hypothetical protein